MEPAKILMFGWEFPPHTIGGLGNVTYNLCNALANLGTKIILILPIKGECNNLKIIPTNFVSIKGIKSLLSPYLCEETYHYQYLLDDEEAKIYAGNLKDEINRFTKRGVEIAKHEKFDIIHCHDWMTFPAGMQTKEFSGKPLILHVHTTELDRSCGGCNPFVYNIELEAFNKADKIIAVSNYTKNKIIKNYNISKDKIEVVHNAIEFDGIEKNKPCNRKKIVLYLGRLSMHKGPDYFIRAAKRVLDYKKDILFVMAGGGELLPEMIDLACNLGIQED
jgi:glycosyltransferase involved in cell wall biosynthesis